MKIRPFLTLTLSALLLSSCGTLDPGSKSSSTSETPSTTSIPTTSETSEESQTAESSQGESSAKESSETTSDSREVIPGLIEKEVEVNVVSYFGEHPGEDEAIDSCFYSDYWFLSDSSEVNYPLALMSSLADGAADSNKLDTVGRKATALLTNLGYSDIEMNTYFKENISLENSIGAIVGRKKIQDYSGKEYTLLAAFPRSSGYGAEWGGNFDIGKEGMHKGFKEARDEALRFLKRYIASHGIVGDIKLWVAGYSRGGATANLLGGFLAEDTGYLPGVTLNPKDLFVYTIASPSAAYVELTKDEALSVSGPRGEGYYDTEGEAFTFVGGGNIDFTDARYDGIHNFVANGDFVPKLPPEAWGFTRFGHTDRFDYGSPAWIENMSKYSPSVAENFRDKNYSTPLPLQAFDLDTLSIVDTDVLISTDEYLQNRVDTIIKFAEDREGFIDKGYAELAGAALSIFGVDFDSFKEGVLSDIMGIVKAVGLSYLARAKDVSGKDINDVAACIIMDLLSLLGKKIEDKNAYTDQDFLKDVLDFLFNDAFDNTLAYLRNKVFSLILPAPYGDFYGGLLDYAKENEKNVTTVDALVALLADYVHDNKEKEGVIAIVDVLGGLIPAQYASYLGYLTGKTYNPDDYETPELMNRAIVFDLLDCMSIGKFDDEGELVANGANFRYVLFSFAGGIFLGNTKSLGNLLLNGASDSEGEIVVKDPAPFADLVGDILSFVLPKNDSGDPMTIGDAADKAIVNLLEKGKTEKNAVYVERLQANPATARELIMELVFGESEEYSLKDDVDTILNVVKRVQFFYPSHYFEMYVSYFRSLA